MCRLIIHHFTSSSQTLQVTPPTQKKKKKHRRSICQTIQGFVLHSLQLQQLVNTFRFHLIVHGLCPYCSQMLLHHLLQRLGLQLSALRSQTCPILALSALHKRGITASSWDPKCFVLNGPCFLMEDCDFISQGHPGFLTFLLLINDFSSW